MTADKQAQVSGARAEKWLAAAIAAIPLVYLVTDHSWSPVVWHYSYTLLGAIAVYAALYALLLLTYHRALPRPIVQLRTQLVVIGFGVVIALLGLEAALATFDDRPNVKTESLRGYAPDPDTGYVYIPNHRQEVRTLESATRWRSNSKGLRAERDFGARPEGVLRILALGDSFTVNTAVEARDTWPAVLERRLLETFPARPGFEVVNAGHAGYGTMHMLRWYQKYGLDLKPDIVLVAMTPNDITDNGTAPPGALTAVDGYLASRGSGARERRQLFEHRQRWYSLAGHILGSRVWNLLTRISFDETGGPKLAAYHEQLDDKEERLHGLTEQYLLQIRDLAASQDASFGLLLVTFREQLGEIAPGYSGSVFGDRWTRFAEKNDIDVVDTYEPLRKHSGEPPLFWRWDNHYTKEGSRVAGESALELVSQMLRRKAHASSTTPPIELRSGSRVQPARQPPDTALTSSSG